MNGGGVGTRKGARRTRKKPRTAAGCVHERDSEAIKPREKGTGRLVVGSAQPREVAKLPVPSVPSRTEGMDGGGGVGWAGGAVRERGLREHTTSR